MTKITARCLTMLRPAVLLSFGVIVLIGLSVTEVAGQVPNPATRNATEAQVSYPDTRRDSVAEIHHGVRVPDPYRWLEDLTSAETRGWIEAQRVVTASVLERIPFRDAILSRVQTFRDIGRRISPILVGRQLYLVERRQSDGIPVLFASDSAAQIKQLVFDPYEAGLHPDLVPRDFVPSGDGRYIAYFVSASGRDYGEHRVWDVARRQHLADTLRGIRYSALRWLPDSRSFVYTRNKPGADMGGTSATSPGRQLALHSIGTPQPEDVLLHESAGASAWVRTYAVSPEGRFAVFLERDGGRARVMIVDLTLTEAHVLPPAREILGAGAHVPIGFLENVLLIRTLDGAPNGRIVAVDVADSALAPLRTIVAETNEVLMDAALSGRHLVVHSIADVQSRLRLHSMGDAPTVDIALPAPGVVSTIVASTETSDFFFHFTSTLIPMTAYRYGIRTHTLQVFDAGRTDFDATRYETRQIFFTSKDGTRVPMFLTARRGIALDGSTALMMTAYGGFGSAMLPYFGGSKVIPWLEMGGAFALVNVRGGGEYGESWHQGGIGPRKQTVFDDVIAAAEYLVREGYTRPERLVLHGESNGGMTLGAVITQRPDLFRVALPVSGVFDMLRFHLFTVGRNWITDTGSADDSTAFPYIYAYSPLHNVRTGTCYPSTLVLAAEDDDRVVPSHSYKFAATLQAAQSCARPVLLRTTKGLSHMAGSAAAEDGLTADMLAFAAAQLGLTAPTAWQ